MENQPIVSVSMITYKHEEFIKQAIEGVLMQETTFEFDLIIADDCSPDDTEKIVRDIIATHPKGHLIKYFRHKQNLGMQANGLFATKQCKDKYIAICEGDDYWTDPLKLQKQVDFMEANPDFSMCFTRYQRYFQDTNLFQISGHNRSKVFKLKDFMHANHAATATVLIRNIKFDLKYLRNTPFGDWTLYNLILRNGDAYYMDDVTAVYRRHSYNSEYYNPLPYKKKLYKLNFIFLKIHGFKYLSIYIKKIIQMSIFNKLH